MSPDRTEIVVQPGGTALASFLICHNSSKDYDIKLIITPDNSNTSDLKYSTLSHKNTAVNGYSSSLFNLLSPSADIVCKEAVIRLLNRPCLNYSVLTIGLMLVLSINEISKSEDGGQFRITMEEHDSQTENCINRSKGKGQLHEYACNNQQQVIHKSTCSNKNIQACINTYIHTYICGSHR